MRIDCAPIRSVSSAVAQNCGMSVTRGNDKVWTVALTWIETENLLKKPPSDRSARDTGHRRVIVQSHRPQLRMLLVVVCVLQVITSHKCMTQ